MPPVTPKPSPYAAVFTFNWLSASGTACFLAALFGAAAAGLTPRQFAGMLGRTAKQMALAELTLAAVLGLAFLMNYSGATATLGLAFAATGAVFPFFSAMLGWLGVFLTGSDTSANALFGSSAGGDGRQAGNEPGIDGGGQFERRRDGQDDQRDEHRHSRGGHGDEAGGRSPAFPVHAEAQHTAGFADRDDCDVLCVCGAILGALAPAFQFGDRLRNPQ